MKTDINVFKLSGKLMIVAGLLLLVSMFSVSLVLAKEKGMLRPTPPASHLRGP